MLVRLLSPFFSGCWVDMSDASVKKMSETTVLAPLGGNSICPPGALFCREGFGVSSSLMAGCSVQQVCGAGESGDPVAKPKVN